MSTTLTDQLRNHYDSTTHHTPGTDAANKLMQRAAAVIDVLMIKRETEARRERIVLSLLTGAMNFPNNNATAELLVWAIEAADILIYELDNRNE